MGPREFIGRSSAFASKTKREHLASAANLLPVNSAGPHVVVVRQRIAQPMGQRDSMGQISWRINGPIQVVAQVGFRVAVGPHKFIGRSGAFASKTNANISPGLPSYYL